MALTLHRSALITGLLALSFRDGARPGLRRRRKIRHRRHRHRLHTHARTASRDKAHRTRTPRTHSQSRSRARLCSPRTPRGRRPHASSERTTHTRPRRIQEDDLREGAIRCARRSCRHHVTGDQSRPHRARLQRRPVRETPLPKPHSAQRLHASRRGSR